MTVSMLVCHLLCIVIQSYALQLPLVDHNILKSGTNTQLVSAESLGMKREYFNHGGCKTLSITKWNGRDGNHVFQLVNALGYAELAQCSQVQLPNSYRYLHNGIFNLPQNITIQQPLTASLVSTCAELNHEENQTDIFYKPKCFSSASMRKSLIDKYLVQYLLPEDQRCGNAKKDFDGLVVHLRGGDVMGGEFHHQQPPCSMYVDILTKQKVKRMLLVSDLIHDLPVNPCKDEIQKKFPKLEIVVQSLSLPEDACAIMTARSLVHSQGSFSRAFALFNKQFRTMPTFEPLPHDRSPMVSFDLNADEYFKTGCEAAPSTVFYAFPDIEELRNQTHGCKGNPRMRRCGRKQRMEWMIQSEKSNIVKRTCV